VKTKTLKIEKDSPLVFERMYQEQLELRINELKALVEVGKAHLRENLMEAYSDVDWGLVHDIRFSLDGVELITFEHPMEQLIGPMSEDERTRLEQAREIALAHGIGTNEKETAH